MLKNTVRGRTNRTRSVFLNWTMQITWIKRLAAVFLRRLHSVMLLLFLNTKLFCVNGLHVWTAYRLKKTPTPSMQNCTQPHAVLCIKQVWSKDGAERNAGFPAALSTLWAEISSVQEHACKDRASFVTAHSSHLSLQLFPIQLELEPPPPTSVAPVTKGRNQMKKKMYTV